MLASSRRLSSLEVLPSQDRFVEPLVTQGRCPDDALDSTDRAKRKECLIADKPTDGHKYALRGGGIVHDRCGFLGDDRPRVRLFSNPSLSALEWTWSLARESQASVTLLHVIAMSAMDVTVGNARAAAPMASSGGQR